jgi:twitching motility protein PilT
LLKLEKVNMTIQEILQEVVNSQASDLHLIAGFPPILRVTGELRPASGGDKLTPARTKELVLSILTPEQKELLLTNREIDFSYTLPDGGRFRINAYFQKGSISAAFRHIPLAIRTIEELTLPKILYDFTKIKMGFVLITGPTGHGKSTTIAAMLNEINATRAEHIVTIEDPIEYIYPPGRSIISQREMHKDTHSWSVALRSVLREDPNIVLIGEMRDYETIAAALTIAETGHLVFATLHTNSAAQTIDRIVDVFPENQQPQIRLQLANTLAAVVSQRLLPSQKSGLVPAVEILLSTAAVRTTIREGKTHMIDNIIQTSKDAGMMPLEASLAEKVKKGVLAPETAREWSLRPKELMRLIG